MAKENPLVEFFYLIRYRSFNVIFDIKEFFQRIFRKHHCSDSDLWNLDTHLAKLIYPKLKAYIYSKRHGVPMLYVEYEECRDMFKSLNEYDEAVKQKKHIGGGIERWEAHLTEMLFAMDFYAHYEYWEPIDDKNGFLARWGYNIPGIRRNTVYKYVNNYTKETFLSQNVLDTSKDIDLRESTVVETELPPDSLFQHLSRRALEGSALLGINFGSLWD
jgi:hypothetical protein